MTTTTQSTELKNAGTKNANNFANSDETISEWVEQQEIKTITVPDPFPMDSYYTPADSLVATGGQVADAHDIHKLNDAIDKLRVAIYATNKKLNEAVRKTLEAKLYYDRQFNRVLLTTQGRTEMIRKTLAAIKTEDFEQKWRTRELIVKDLEMRLKIMIVELDSLKTLALNIRREMEVK